ncbi:putative nuclease HARBI1 [Portunus trituberculatus]|uniref:putative nuclease HARBI1 n=1 Tax=Portunus trituberculatus TaxID=210409 RepID=UPI001E1CC863|nr:putative nuclease HARBI1 [Portunus trituberculatus]
MEQTECGCGVCGECQSNEGKFGQVWTKRQDIENYGSGPRRRRTFHERRYFLMEYSDSQLIERFRLDRAGILYVTDLVRDALGSQTARNKALSPEMKVAITLGYLATGKMQLCSSDDFGTSQPTVSRAITQTLEALAQRDNFRKFINFPFTQQEVQRKQEQFMQVAGFPSVAGVVDGTHIRIIAPREHEAEHVNRKRFHSINVQVVFDATYRILDIVAKWPGSVNDASLQ